MPLLRTRTIWIGLPLLMMAVGTASAQQAGLPAAPDLRLPGVDDLAEGEDGVRDAYVMSGATSNTPASRQQAETVRGRAVPRRNPVLPQVPARLEQPPALPDQPGITTSSIVPEQQFPPPPPPPPAQADTQDGGLRLGAFILSGEVETGGVYSFRRGDTREHAIGLRSAPDLRLTSNWPRHELQFSARGEFIAWNRGGDDARGNLGATLRLDARRDTRLRLAVDYGVDDAGIGSSGSEGQHEVDSTIALEHERYRTTIALTAGALRHFERGNAQDYTQPHVSLRGRLRTSPALAVYGEVGGDARLYDEKRDSSGIKRNSLGGYVEAGVELLRGPIWEGRVGVRLAGRHYKESSIEDFIGVGGNGNLTWRPTPHTEAGLEAAFSLEDDAAGRVRNQTVALSLRQQLRRDVEARGRLEAENNDVNSGNDVLTLRASASLAWQIWRRLWLVANYGWEKDLVRGGANSQAEHIVGLGLRQTF